MVKRVCGWMLAAAVAVPLWAQGGVKMPMDLDKLAARASESVDVTLDASMLATASKFLSSNDPDQAQVRKLVSKLKGIYVRSFEFDKEGMYSLQDVEQIRAQLKSPGWARIVSVKSSKGERSEVYLLKNGDQIGGLVVIDAEPKELTVVNIDGAINPEDLSKLGGNFGIPRMEKDGSSKGSKDTKPTGKDEE